MDAERWERMQQLFHGALERPEADRRRYLEAAAGTDATLLGTVLRMLEADASACPLDGDLARVAEQVFRVDTAELPLTDFGPYRITKLLGEGGMGVVYLARRSDLGSVAAHPGPAPPSRHRADLRRRRPPRRDAVVCHGVRRGGAADRLLPDPWHQH
jgi:hypothetical protein